MGSLVKEFWLFLREEKKYWLVPMLVVMGVVGVLVWIASAHGGLAPFIYPFM